MPQGFPSPCGPRFEVVALADCSFLSYLDRFARSVHLTSSFRGLEFLTLGLDVVDNALQIFHQGPSPVRCAPGKYQTLDAHSQVAGITKA